MASKIKKHFIHIALLQLAVFTSVLVATSFHTSKINLEAVAAEQSPNINIKAYKVVCQNEEDLPNWGEGGSSRPDIINASTASDYVSSSEGQCWLEENWQFQWGFGNDVDKEIEGVNKLQGDHLGAADGTPSTCYYQCGDNTNTGSNYEDWKNFDTATSNNGNTPAQVSVNEDFNIPGIWVREKLKANYISYTYPPKGSIEDNKTAELYCHHDIRNFDNYDYIYNPQPGNTYYCVAFNALKGESIDLKVTKDDEETTVYVGENLTYTIEVSNKGDRVAKNLEVKDTLPAELEFISADNGGTISGSVVTWKISELAPGDKINLELKVKVKDSVNIENSPQFTNKVEVKDDGTSGEDQNPEDNYDEDTDLLKEEVSLETPVLKLTKSNNASGNKFQTGEKVKFTLKLEAFEDLDNVKVVDLPAKGFKYVKNTWTANSSTRGDIKGNSTVAEPTYASPGTWTIGDMSKGETIVLSYVTTIDSSVDDGIYKDIAWARGYYRNSYVLANDLVKDLDTFVGTEVEVISTNDSPKADVDIDVEEVIKIQEVLGASTSRLPETGINNVWIIAVVAMFVAGVVFIGAGLLGSLKPIKVVLIVGALLVGTLLLSGKALAASEFDLRVEEPQTEVNEEFNIGFVALDINNNNIVVQCFVKKPGAASFVKFGSDFNTGTGGNSGNCVVDTNVLNSQGNYEFKINANNGTDTIESSVIKVKYDKEGPSKPKWIKKDKKAECKYEITLKTGDDSGNTSYVEIYREDKPDFEAKASTRIKTVSIGSNEEYKFIDTLSGNACGETQYYAVRAFDAAGNASKVRSEGDIEDIVIKEVTVEPKTTGAIDTSGNTGTNAGGSNTTQEGKSNLGDLGLELGENDMGDVLGKDVNRNSSETSDLDNTKDGAGFPWLLLLPIAFIGLYMIIRRDK